MDFINNKYNYIIERLKQQKRALITLTKHEKEKAAQKLGELNKQNALSQEYTKLLCMLDHSDTTSDQINQEIIWILQNRIESDLLVYTLSASANLIIKDCEKKSERIPFDLIKALKSPLTNPSLEVVEWSLRIIEQLGTQGIFLKDDVIAVGKKFTLFNSHKSNINDIRNLLLNRWQVK